MGGNSTKSNEVKGQNLLPFARAAAMQTGPIRGEYLGQALEALKTGGVGAQIPLISRSVEQSRAAAGQAFSGTQQQLNAAGLGGTPAGQNILANLLMQGRQQTSQIPTQIAQTFAGGGADASMSALQAILGSLASQGKGSSRGGGGGLLTS